MSLISAESHDAMQDVCSKAEALSTAMAEAEVKGADFGLVDAEWLALTQAVVHWKSEMAKSLGVSSL